MRLKVRTLCLRTRLALATADLAPEASTASGSDAVPVSYSNPIHSNRHHAASPSYAPSLGVAAPAVVDVEANALGDVTPTARPPSRTPAASRSSPASGGQPGGASPPTPSSRPRGPVTPPQGARLTVAAPPSDAPATEQFVAFSNPIHSSLAAASVRFDREAEYGVGLVDDPVRAAFAGTPAGSDDVINSLHAVL